MPRDSSGVYKLPAGNPVAPDTVIESEWANSTLDDVAVALTGSLARSGVAPMLGPLVLSADPIVQARQAASKAYVDQFLAYSTGMPIAAISPYAGPAAPPGWLLCDGQVVNRATYADLFAAIGTIYGNGDGSTTFNLPDLRNEFIRGLGGSRVLGSKQIGSFAAHTHGITDPGHSHNHAHGFDATTTVESAQHTHTVNDPGHFHSYEIAGGTGGSLNTGGASVPLGNKNVTSAATGITLDGENAPHTHDVSGTTYASSVSSLTSISTVGAGGAETVPQNMALNYYIKAINDSVAVTTPVLAVESSDTEMITINSTVPSIPVIQPRANVPGGIPKLDANGKVPLAQIPNSVQNNLGFFDASSGNLPSGTFASGDTYTISVGGTLTVYDPVTLVAAPTVVPAGTDIIYITGSPTNPTGWYAAPLQTNVVASSVAFTPSGTIAAGNVQAAIAELDSETQTKLAAKLSLAGGTLTGPLQLNDDLTMGAGTGANIEVLTVYDKIITDTIHSATDNPAIDIAADGSVTFPNTATPSVTASTPATQPFPSGVDTKAIDYFTPSTPNVPAGWNGATGEFTVAKSGWYDVAAWVSVGQFPANSLDVALAARNPSAVNYPIASAGIIAPSGGRAYIAMTCSRPAYLAAGSKVWLTVNIAWTDNLTHPNTDGATQFTVAYLHP